MCSFFFFFLFFFNDTAPTEIYTLSLHDALPIYHQRAVARRHERRRARPPGQGARPRHPGRAARSEEHTSELQSRQYLVCRLLLEKKKKKKKNTNRYNYKYQHNRVDTLTKNTHHI